MRFFFKHERAHQNRFGVKLTTLKVFENFVLKKCGWKFSRLVILLRTSLGIRRSEICVAFAVVCARCPFIHVQQAHEVTCKEIYSLLVVYFHFRSNYQTFAVLNLDYFYSLSRHAYEINPWLYHKPSTDAAIGNGVKGRFPTLKANLYLISWHLSFLFLSFSSDYRSLCLLLAGKNMTWQRFKSRLLSFQQGDFRFWHFAGTIDRGKTIGALKLPITCFFADLDIPFSDKAHKLSALLAYKRSYMPTMTMYTHKTLQRQFHCELHSSRPRGICISACSVVDPRELSENPDYWVYCQKTLNRCGWLW